MTADEETRLSEPGAADELGVELERLRRWRNEGAAPPHDTDEGGDVFYRRRDLVTWREHYVYPPGELDNGRGAR